jgi:beta-galactosidase/beta-glucuronidase
MSNRIKDVSIKNVRVNPVQADIDVTVYPETLSATTAVRGRLVGPSCVNTSTVEVAYPVRETSREKEATPLISLRAIIPEPCLWDEQSPFLYKLILELWQDGKLCDQKSLMHAITRQSPPGHAPADQYHPSC